MVVVVGWGGWGGWGDSRYQTLPHLWLISCRVDGGLNHGTGGVLMEFNHHYYWGPGRVVGGRAGGATTRTSGQFTTGHCLHLMNSTHFLLMKTVMDVQMWCFH